MYYLINKLKINNLRNVLRRQFAILIVFLIYAPLFAQNTLDSTLVYLQRAKKLFHEKDYYAMINETDKGLAFYDGKERNTTYVDLLKYKAVAYCWINDYRSAMPFYREAVITYCDLFGKNNLPCHMGKDFISIYRRSGWENFSDNVYVLCLHSVFRNNCISNDTSYKENLKFYKFYIEALTGFYSHNIDLDAEYNTVWEINNPLLQEYVNYARGCRKIEEIVGAETSRKDKLSGISILEQVAGRIKEVNNPAAKLLLYNVYCKIANTSIGLENFVMAANYYKKGLELSQVYWRNWGDRDPWGNLSSCLDAMKTAHMNTEVIECCNKVLLDPNASKQHVTCAIEAQREVYELLGKNTKQKETYSIQKSEVPLPNNTSKVIEDEVDADAIIALYEKSGLSKHLIDSIFSYNFYFYNSFFNYDKLFRYLLEDRKDYELLIQIASNLHDVFFDNADSISFITPLDLEDKGIDINRLGEYEKTITYLRSTWHFGNGLNVVWLTCNYLAIAYFRINDLENAIKFQKEVYDLVRLDWESDPAERTEFVLSGYVTRDISRPNYLDIEQEKSLYLAYLYLESKDYEDAYKVLEKKLEAVLEILSDQLAYGIDSVKYNTWEVLNQYIFDITFLIIDYIDLYPPLIDLIQECNSIIKGFMLNFYVETYNITVKSDNAFDLYKRIKQYEQNKEAVYYNHIIPLSDLTNLQEKIERHYLELNDVIDYSEIVRHSRLTISELEDKLDHSDVLVDFFTINNVNDKVCEKVIGNVFDTIVDGKTYWGVTVKNYPNPTFYALITRNGWRHPKVVKIGSIADFAIDKARDMLDCVYQQEDYVPDINKLYRSTKFGDMIWGKIIEVGNVKKGENIYFCPTSYLNDVAIEYLTVGSDGVMSERYNMYRLSTIRELNSHEILFNKGDNCVAFGDIIYSSNKNDKKESLTDSRKAINMASIPEAMFDRNILKGLDSTRGILRTISKKLPKAKVIRGEDATEESFYNLSGKSPELLVIATHGYNFEREILNDENHDYLFGNRDYTLLSEQEQSMYKSGLYMAKSRNDIPTNGMLTAKEISMCDLHNTKLAILAACVSALGNNTNEGVFGIQRGLKMAGVRSMLVSLWDVDAEATQLLIEEFVRRYVTGTSAHKALIAAQQYVKAYEDKNLMGDKHKFSSPYYWAGFILID